MVHHGTDEMYLGVTVQAAGDDGPPHHQHAQRGQQGEPLRTVVQYRRWEQQNKAGRRDENVPAA